MSKPIPFEPIETGICALKWGQLVIGKDGTLLYGSTDVKTQKITWVPLFTNETELVKLLQAIDYLVQVYKDHAKQEHEPADQSFDELLNSFKPTGKPN